MAKAPRKTDAPGATAPYEALTYIEHDGEPYDAGEVLELTERQAAALIEVKAVLPAGAPAAEGPADA
jgi:hypothetical protein